MLIFVYGTLKKGEPNHAKLEGARFVRRARTEPRYELVDLGGYPALLENGETTIHGEVYEVDARRLEMLDRFEDVPSLYERKRIRLSDDHVEAYVMPRDRVPGAPRIVDGDWRSSATPSCS